MSASPESGSIAAQLRLEVDLAYGGVYAGTSFEFSPAAAAHFNDAATRANGVLPGEFVPFSAGTAVSVACPAHPMPRPDFIAAYRLLRAVFDGSLEIRLADHPHLFSADPVELDSLRGVPTYLPTSIFPAGFLGRAHTLELYQDETRLFGPAERFLHTPATGALFNQIEDAPGALVLEVRGNLDVLAHRGEVVFFSDPAFGEPAAVSQLEDDGASVPLEWHLLGRDRVGDVMLFNEWVAVGVQPRGDRLVLEVRYPNRATGLAAALYSGHTRDAAFRADATVL